MNTFQHSLFGCFDNCYVCVCVYFCPCYVAGKVAESLGDSCCLHTFAFICCPCVSIFLQCFERGKIRQERNIPGSQCGDFCTHYWCMACALCQEANELNALGGSMAEEQSIERV